jgi:hypothetical protein
MGHRFCNLAAIFVVHWSLLLECSSVACQDKIEENPVVAEAKKRQEQVITLDVRFKQKQFVPKGGLTASLGGARKLYKLDPKTELPAQDTTLVSTRRLVLDGKKVRFERSQLEWHFPAGELRKQDFVGVFNGVDAKGYKNGVDAEHPSDKWGSIAKSDFFIDLRVLELQPILVAYRGLTSSMTPSGCTRLEKSGNVVPYDGLNCEEFIIKQSSTAFMRFLLEPERGYMIRRIQSVIKGEMREQIDITYKPHPASGWFPTSWIDNQYVAPDGQLVSSKTVEVESILVNEQIPAAEFELAFPPKTDVYNAKDGKFYVVTKDGALGPSAFGPTPKEPELPRERNRSSLLVLMFMFAGAFVVCALILVVRRRKKMRSSAG